MDADGDVGPDHRPCTVLAVGFPIKIINFTATTVLVLPYDNCRAPVPSRPRAAGAFGSRHSRFRWISSHLGGQWASSNFLLLRRGSTSKGFSEPLTERFLYG